jgi:RNase P protein component
MREHVRVTQDKIAKGWDCLFIARHGAGEASLEQMSQAIGQVLVRAKLLNESN